jgi:tRNA(fMet)-specific endonuclease VapC
MSCLSLAELRHGLEMQRAQVRKKDEAAFEALLQDIPALGFDQDAAKAFGILAATGKLKRSQAIDNLIAAHAISQRAVLVTNNEKDFKGYPGLTVENWA